jgi:hypothetical protein
VVFNVPVPAPPAQPAVKEVITTGELIVVLVVAVQPSASSINKFMVPNGMPVTVPVVLSGV